MSAVGEAKIIISADDRTGSAFQSLERKVKGLGQATRSVGDAAGSIGKISGEVDKVSGSVSKATASVDRFAGVLKSMDGGAAAIGRVAASVDKAAATMPKLTGDANAMARAMQGVAAAERNVAAETDRISRAGSKLSLFKVLKDDFRGARATFDAAKAELDGLARRMEDNERRVNALRQRRDIALAAEARARATYEANPIPGRADAADKARFDAMKAARSEAASIMMAAEKDRKKIEADLHSVEGGTEARKLSRDYADAQKAAALTSSALEMQRAALKNVKAEFEALAGPIVTVSGAEKRLVSDAEAATKAFEEQARAAGVMAEATEAAMHRETASFARAAEGRARWRREFEALEEQAGGQRGALALPRRASAVEALHEALRRPGHAVPHTAAAREASAVAGAQMRLGAFREVQGNMMGLGSARIQANAEAARLARQVAGATSPSAELLSAHEEAQGHAAMATRAFNEQASTLRRLKAEIQQVTGPMHSLASAETQLAERAERSEKILKRQEAIHRRLHALHQVAEDVLPFEGPEVLHLTREALHEGAAMQHERVGLLNAGRTEEEVEEIERRSREVSGRLPTAGAEENLKVIAETTGAFGSVEHAMEHLEFMQKTMSVLKTAGGEHIHGSVGDVGRDFAKFFEERLTKPEEFEQEAKQMIPAMVASGGVFNPREMYMFAQQAKSALPNYDMEFLSKIAPSLITAQGGERAGTAANAFNSIVMGKVNDKKQTEAWEQFGLLDERKVLKKAGHAVSWTAGAVKDTDLALRNPLQWAEEVALPAMRAKGIDVDNRLELAKVLGTMFRNQNGNMFANEIMQAASRSRLHKDANLYGKVSGLDDVYNRNLHEDVTVALPALGEALKTFAANLTSPVMKDAANVLGSMSEKVAHWGEGFANFERDHPTLGKTVSTGSIATALGVGGYLTTKLFTNLGGLFRGGAGAAALTGSAGALSGAAGELTAAAIALRGGGLPGGIGSKLPTGAIVPAGGGVTGAVVAPAAVELGAAIVAGGIAVAAVGLVKASFESQEPGMGGQWSPATAATRADDQRRMEEQQAEADRLKGEIDRNKRMEKLPGTSDTLNIPLQQQLDEKLNQIEHTRRSLVDVDAAASHEARVGRAFMAIPKPEEAGPYIPAEFADRYAYVDREAERGRAFAAMRPPEEFGPPMPPPPAGIERRTFAAYLDYARPEAAAGHMPAATPPGRVPDLHDLKATVDGPVTATVTGSADVTVKVVVEAGSALISAAAAASQGRASMPLTSGNGSSGGTGVQRTSAAPGTGPTWGAGHR